MAYNKRGETVSEVEYIKTFSQIQMQVLLGKVLEKSCCTCKIVEQNTNHHENRVNHIKLSSV